VTALLFCVGPSTIKVHDIFTSRITQKFPRSTLTRRKQELLQQFEYPTHLDHGSLVRGPCDGPAEHG
jgi:hypothetical protein